MKNLILYTLFFNISLMAEAQLCPGGGTDFSNAVTFDPSWIYGCNTGTSCNGGVHFDNRINAVSPQHLLIRVRRLLHALLYQIPPRIYGSDFYPSATTVTLRSFQNHIFCGRLAGVQWWPDLRFAH